MRGTGRGRVLLASVAVVALLSGCGAGTFRAYATLHRVRVSENGSGLDLIGIHGACDKVLRPVVQQTAREVKVSVPLDMNSGVCPAVGVPLDVRVQLDAPLGQRKVLDGQTDEVLPQSV